MPSNMIQADLQVIQRPFIAKSECIMYTVFDGKRRAALLRRYLLPRAISRDRAVGFMPWEMKRRFGSVC